MQAYKIKRSPWPLAAAKRGDGKEKRMGEEDGKGKGKEKRKGEGEV